MRDSGMAGSHSAYASLARHVIPTLESEKRMRPSSTLAIAFAVGLLLATSASARAQSTRSARLQLQDTAGATQSVDTPRDTLISTQRVQQNAWLSGGLGAGGEGGSGIAVIASGWYAHGHAVIGARMSEGSPWERETDTRENAVLIGARARTQHAFVLGAVGAGRMWGSHSNGEQSGTRTPIPGETSLALGVEAGVTYHVIGLGLDLFSASTSRISYRGAALVLQLGYLD